MTQEPITEYFEQLAQDFKPIAHDPDGIHRFSVVDEDTIAEAIREKLYFRDWCLLLEETTPNVRANEARALNEYRTFRFTICKDASSESNQNRRQIFYEAEDLSKHLFMKILRDCRASGRPAPNTPAVPFALKDMEHKFEMEKYQDIFNADIIGIDTQISIKEPFKESDYNDLTLWN